MFLAASLPLVYNEKSYTFSPNSTPNSTNSTEANFVNGMTPFELTLSLLITLFLLVFCCIGCYCACSTSTHTERVRTEKSRSRMMILLNGCAKGSSNSRRSTSAYLVQNGIRKQTQSTLKTTRSK